jgi:hypothetical protein
VRGSRHILIVVLLLAPVLGLVTSTGGLPFCCWTMPACPMTRQARIPAGVPAGMPASMPDCHMARMCPLPAAPPLILPSPAVPVFPVAAPSLALPATSVARTVVAAPVRAYRGWPLAVFHPPQV